MTLVLGLYFLVFAVTTNYDHQVCNRKCHVKGLSLWSSLTKEMKNSSILNLAFSNHRDFTHR